MPSVANDYEKRRKEWMRGQTPTDISIKCLRLCAKYLGGVWSEISESQLTVRRITGGFTNQLYFCGLSSDCQTIANEPKEVVIRFYGKKWITTDETNERFNDIVITLLASERSLGAKQFAYFDGGNIEEYIKSHTFGLSEQNDPKCVDRLARMLARFHSMSVPMTRSDNWFADFLDDKYAKAYELFPIEQMMIEANATTFLSINLKDEIQWLKKCLTQTKSPIVFSHNDFRGPNVMVRDSDKNSDDSKDIKICDFEYSCYAYRGFDFGALFEDWGRTDSELVAGDVPESVIKEFMSSYLEENYEMNGQKYRSDDSNRMEQLVKEAKVFSLAQQMFFVMFILSTEEMPYQKTKIQFMKRGDQRLKQYLKLKKRYLGEGIVSAHYNH